jgi:hypothetical protein
MFDVAAQVSMGRLIVRWYYSEELHDRSTVAGLVESYLGTLREIIAHCTQLSLPGREQD